MQAPVVLRSFLQLSALLVPLAAQGAEPVSQTAAATVTLEPVAEGRRLVQLPSIDFSLRLAPQCATDLAFESLSISIADTHKTYRAGDFESAAVIETSLHLPGRQIGPIAVDDFCVAEASASPTTLTIADAFTANVSVRCSSETQQSVSYDTLALDLLLVCKLPSEIGGADAVPDAAADDTPEENQEESSPPMFRF